MAPDPDAAGVPATAFDAPAEAPSPVPHRARVVMVVNEEWFFRSHFRPWTRAAAEAGFQFVLLTRPDGSGATWPPDQITVVDSGATRRGLRQSGLTTAAGRLRRLVMAAGDGVVVHAIGLHGLSVAALARAAGLRAPLVVSLTGLGLIGSAGGLVRPLGLAAVSAASRLVDGPTTIWLAENTDDPVRVGLDRAVADGRCRFLTGVGVDPAEFPVEAMPPRPPLRLVLIARMIRSKGIGAAVEALTLARSRGIDARLTLVGAPDDGNPRSLPVAELAGLADRPGVTWLGHRPDIGAILSSHHALVLPSQGGEGLPRVLLEAAAASRPAIVTDVPGCRDFVESGRTGFVVPAGSTEALAGAFAAAADADLPAMGGEARLRVLTSGTVEAVAAEVIAAYRRLRAEPRDT